MFYTDLFASLNRNKVDYLLIGGLAVSLHGVERTTMDVDITVSMTPENLSALIKAANEMKLTPVLPVPLESLGNLELLEQWHSERNLAAFALRSPDLIGVTLDILLFPPMEFASMMHNTVTFEVAGIEIRTASIDDLIALKQAVARPVDITDIEHLKRLKTL